MDFFLYLTAPAIPGSPYGAALTRAGSSCPPGSCPTTASRRKARATPTRSTAMTMERHGTKVLPFPSMAPGNPVWSSFVMARSTSTPVLTPGKETGGWPSVTIAEKAGAIFTRTMNSLTVLPMSTDVKPGSFDWIGMTLIFSFSAPPPLISPGARTSGSGSVSMGGKAGLSTALSNVGLATTRG